MFGQGIKVRCKKCNREAIASTFVLDPVFRMMVCPACVKDRKQASLTSSMKAKNEAEAAEKAKTAPPKPAGWDAEDDYLEKSYRLKQRDTVQCRRIDDEKVQYSCPKCKYTFIYNTRTKRPSACPYCCTNILRINC